jgi:glyoxylase-like metal-dependent hydrolase (beta-lactamase superfamily II)
MGTVNAYLVKGQYNTLIDCGEKTDQSWKALVDGLKRYQLNPEDIDKLIITHAHVDHIGMAQKFAENSRSEIHVSSYVKEWATDLDRLWEERNIVMHDTFAEHLDNQKKETFLPIFKSFFGKVSNHWDCIEPEYIKIFDPHGSIDISGTTYQSIHCPGHSFTQTCFYNAQNGDFLSADMLLKITPTCVVESDQKNSSKRNRSMAQLINSFEKLKEMDISKIYPGHYQPMNNHKALIDKQLDRIIMRKEQCYSLIKNGISRYFDLFNVLYEGKMTFPGLVMTLGYLDLLVDENRILPYDSGDGIIYVPV